MRWGLKPAIETGYSYDTMGNLTEIVQYLNTVSERSYDYTYDKAGQILSVTDPLEGISSSTYDALGRVLTVTDPNGGVENYTYDAMGNVTERLNAIGCKTTYTYNVLGLLTEAVDANGAETVYTYDALGRIASMEDEAGKITYTYDAVGNVLTVTDEQGTISRTYDALNRVKTYTDYQGNTVSYSYDELGNLISLTYPGGEIVRYSYYKTGWLKEVNFGEGEYVRYTFDGNGRLITTERSNGTVETRTYDAAGQMVTLKEEKAAAEQATEEDTSTQENVATDSEATTDNAANVDNAANIIYEYHYTYDSAGNITQIEGQSGSAERVVSAKMTYDAANRLLTYNGEEVVYDANGKMTYGPLKGEMVSYTYDCRNRLIQAGDTTYGYDAESTRIFLETDSYREEYVVDKNSTYSQMLTATRYEKKENGELSDSAETITYYYGRGLVAQSQENETDDENNGFLFYHYDHLGSTTALTDSDANVVQKYAYDTYGKLISGDASYTRFLYNGKYGVTQDDNGLLYMRTRYYNVDIRRFINQDVVFGTITNGQSLNRFSYVQGNPLSYTDPFGLSPQDVEQEEANENWLLHSVLDFASVIPVVGVIASVANGILYLTEENYFYAASEFCFAIAGLVMPVGKLMAKAGKLGKAGAVLRTTAHAGETLGYLFGAIPQIFEGVKATKEFIEAKNNGEFAVDKFITAASSFFFGGVGLGRGLRSGAKAWKSGQELADSIKTARAMKQQAAMAGNKRGTSSKIPTWNGSGPEPGVIGINSNSTSNAAIKNYRPKEGMEFVFDASTNTFVVGKNKYNKGWGSPHQKLADSIGANQGASTTLGGIFSRGSDGKIYTNENSGHFGKNWTPALRTQFIETMREYGVEVMHEVWR